MFLTKQNYPKYGCCFLGGGHLNGDFDFILVNFVWVPAFIVDVLNPIECVLTLSKQLESKSLSTAKSNRVQNKYYTGIRTENTARNPPCRANWPHQPDEWIAGCWVYDLLLPAFHNKEGKNDRNKIHFTHSTFSWLCTSVVVFRRTAACEERRLMLWWELCVRWLVVAEVRTWKTPQPQNSACSSSLFDGCSSRRR